MPIDRIYGDDLAAIHNAGYGFHWEAAAPAILQWLRGAGIVSGTVVDLGCGGGQWLARLVEEGYSPVGVDASRSMLREAKKNAPSARLIHGSFAEVELPPCDAVTSLGEPLNYLDSARSFKRTLKNVYRALRPGGLFVFDVREPPTRPVDSRIHARVGDDWACIVVIDEDPKSGRLVRHITTFQREGGTYRRGEEVHRLQLFPKAQVCQWLQDLGFAVRTSRRYGAYRFAPRQFASVARKLAAR
jgi:SAM-dependent methyltransferase